MKIYGYVRVSSTDQNEDGQLIALREQGVDDKTFLPINNPARILNVQTTRNW